MDYAKAVERGRFLLKRSNQDQWELAELTSQIIEQEGHGSGVRWAADLGCTPSHVTRLKAVWDRYGKVDDRQLSFAEYYVLAQNTPQRAREIEDEANRTGRKPSQIVRRRGERLQAALEALRDGKQRREILAHANIRRALERELERDKPKPSKPRRKDGYAGELEDIRERLTRLLDEMIDRDLDDDERARILPVVEEISGIVEWMRSYVKTADRSFEDALDALLAGKLPPPRVEPALPRQTPKPVRARKPKPSPVPEAEPVIEPQPEPPADEDAVADGPPKGRKSRGRPDKGRKAS